MGEGQVPPLAHAGERIYINAMHRQLIAAANFEKNAFINVLILGN